MLAVSTVWCAERDGGAGPALRRLRGMGFEEAELDLGPEVDVADVPAIAREIKIRLVGAEARTGHDGVEALGGDFASTDEARREAHVRRLLALAAAAKRAGTDRVAIRAGVVPVPGVDARWEAWKGRGALGGVSDEVRREVAALLVEREALRDRHLDAACRALHALVRADPETRWVLLPAARPDALPLPDEIEHLLAEMPRGRPAYVHDTAAAAVLDALGVAPANAGLIEADRHLAGLRLSDSFALETGLPPGAGVVDWDVVRDSATVGLPRILHVTRSVEPTELLEGAAFLSRHGLA